MSLNIEQQFQEKGHRDQDASEPGSKGPHRLTQQLEVSSFITPCRSTMAWYVVFLLFLSKGEASALVVLKAVVGVEG